MSLHEEEIQKAEKQMKNKRVFNCNGLDRFD